jgi:ABC-type transport system substrate-binding protein
MCYARLIACRKDNATMSGWQKLASAVILSWAVGIGGPGCAAAQTKPEGEMRFALYVTLAPAWLDPGEAVPDNLTPFWMMYALHDALVKPMPGNFMANSLAESWSMSEDRLVYEFTLRKCLKFHNGDPFTAEDVAFSFKRAKGAQLHEKVKEVVIVDPYKVQFVLHEPWPDFMAFYGTLASAAGWITPKNYFEKVGPDGFLQHPIGLGPNKFVSMKSGIELVMEANEDYWRKVPSVKRLVFRSVPEGSTRLAMLRAGEVDVAYLLEGELGESIRNDANLKLVFSGGIGTSLSTSSTCGTRNRPGPTSACARRRASRSTGRRSATPIRSALLSPTATSCSSASNMRCRSHPTVAIPTRACSSTDLTSRRPTASMTRSPARTARSASSSCARG